MSHTIYGLYDPTDDQKTIRYVGYTSKSPSRRLIEHVAEAKASATCHRHKWIRSVLKKGVKPVVVVIEVVDAESWQERERYWIGAHGSSLVNGTVGGDGLVNPSKDVRDRISAKVSATLVGNNRRANVSHSEKDKKAISDGLKNSAKFRAAMNARRGRPVLEFTDEIRKKISESKKGKPRPDISILANALNAARVGSVWINNGSQNKQLKAGEPMPDGWVKGRLPRG